MVISLVDFIVDIDLFDLLCQSIVHCFLIFQCDAVVSKENRLLHIFTHHICRTEHELKEMMRGFMLDNIDWVDNLSRTLRKENKTNIGRLHWYSNNRRWASGLSWLSRIVAGCITSMLVFSAALGCGQLNVKKLWKAVSLLLSITEDLNSVRLFVMEKVHVITIGSKTGWLKEKLRAMLSHTNRNLSTEDDYDYEEREDRPDSDVEFVKQTKPVSVPVVDIKAKIKKDLVQSIAQKIVKRTVSQANNKTRAFLMSTATPSTSAANRDCADYCSPHPTTAQQNKDVRTSTVPCVCFLGKKPETPQSTHRTEPSRIHISLFCLQQAVYFV